ncbi:MAG TPA: MerC domain-containing protein [Fimbriimonadaceae bacterium]|nr:MerC domain-containing protein [Fimbriimonadaceae bacterium]
MSLTTNSRIDKIGACASAICAVHCALTGAALGLLSVAGLSFLREPWVEALFLLSTVVLGAWAMRHGLRRHGSWIPAAFFIAGLGLVVAKHFLLGDHEESAVGIWTSLLGAGLLVTFFVLNARLPHKACGCFVRTHCPHEGESAVKS